MDEKIETILKILEDSLFNNRVLFQGCLNIIFAFLLAAIPLLLTLPNSPIQKLILPLTIITFFVVIVQIIFFLVIP